MWHTVVLITKGRGDFRGITLIQVLCKAAARILTIRITAETPFHDTLHRFQAVQVTGTAALDTKLLQHITAMREVVLFEVFMDLLNSCGNLHPDMAPRPSCIVYVSSQEGSTSLDVLVPTDHGGQGRKVLWTPVQGVPR